MRGMLAHYHNAYSNRRSWNPPRSREKCNQLGLLYPGSQSGRPATSHLKQHLKLHAGFQVSKPSQLSVTIVEVEHMVWQLLVTLELQLGLST